MSFYSEAIGDLRKALESRRARGAGRYVWTTLAVAVAALIAAAAQRILPLPNLSLVFLSAVLLAAIRFGTAPALYASVVSVFTYNYFFTEPLYTFNVTHQGDFLSLLFFMLVAVLTGNLAGQARARLIAAREHAFRANNLYEFSGKVAGAHGEMEVARTIEAHLSTTFGVPVAIDLSDTSTAPPGGAIADDGVLRAPLISAGECLGQIALAFPAGRHALTVEQRHLLSALASQSAVAIARARLADAMHRAQLLAESENLRSALLSSVSHDLRTPLASIIGSATTLASVGPSLSDADRGDLVETVLEESRRLDRLVQNLLDMTKLSYGGLRPNFDWVDPRDVVGRAVYVMREHLDRFRVRVDIPATIGLMYLDPVLLEQVFINLLDNARRYAPPGSQIAVTAIGADSWVEFRVIDEGPGIPAGDREAVFEMFARTRDSDGRSRGAGLGLAICRGFVAAHGGTIVAAAGPRDRGTSIVIRLPARPAPAAGEEDGDDG